MIHNINFNMLRCQKTTWWFWSNYLAAAHHQTQCTAGTQRLTIKEEEVSQRKANLYNPNLRRCWFNVSRVMPAWAAHDRGLCLLAPSQSLRAQIENRSRVFVGHDPAAHKQDGCYSHACLFVQSEGIRKSFCKHVDL